MPDRRQQQGCIHNADKDTTDTIDLRGDNVVVNDEHQQMVQNTEKLEINVKLQNEYRNRIVHFCKFLEENYP